MNPTDDRLNNIEKRLNALENRLSLATASFAISTWITSNKPSTATPIQKNISESFKIITCILLMGLTWNICHTIISNDNMARGAALMLYTLAAEALIYIGNLRGLKNLRFAGIAIIVFVILRLFFEEIWQMPIFIRTITFVITGLLLIATAWLNKKRH